MIFNANAVHESDETAAAIDAKTDPVDAMTQDTEVDTDSAAGIEAMAAEVNRLLGESSLEALTFFEGGEEAVKKFSESAEVETMLESRKMAKNTFVRLNKVDDLQRRKNLACLVLAKSKNDALWTKLAKNRVMERKLRNAIYAKYGNKANMIARKSQQVHIRAIWI